MPGSRFRSRPCYLRINHLGTSAQVFLAYGTARLLVDAFSQRSPGFLITKPAVDSGLIATSTPTAGSVNYLVGTRVVWPPTFCQCPPCLTQISVNRRGPGT